DVARLNFSHGTHEEHARVIVTLRELAQKCGRPLAILQDLSGPKVRLGAFAPPSVLLKRGQVVTFAAGTAHAVEVPAIAPSAHGSVSQRQDGLTLPLPVPQLLAVLRPGATLLLDDGKIALKVIACEGEPGTLERACTARCLVGGELKPHKGVTAQGVSFEMP